MAGDSNKKGLYMDEDRLKNVMEEVLSTRQVISNDTHLEHHEYLKLLIQREKRRQERWESIRVQVSGWGIVTLLGGIGVAVYNLFIKHNH